MDRQDRRLVANLVLGSLGLITGSVLLGAHRFLWRLWVVVSTLWGLFWIGAAFFMSSAEGIVFCIAVAIVAPLLLLSLIGAIAWVLGGLGQFAAVVSDETQGPGHSQARPESQSK